MTDYQYLRWALKRSEERGCLALFRELYRHYRRAGELSQCAAWFALDAARATDQ
jgi:hypothetical protein